MVNTLLEVLMWSQGFPNLFIQNVEQIRGRDVVFVVSFLNHDALLANLSGQDYVVTSPEVSYLHTSSIPRAFAYNRTSLFSYWHNGES